MVHIVGRPIYPNSLTGSEWKIEVTSMDLQACGLEHHFMLSYIKCLVKTWQRVV